MPMTNRTRTNTLKVVVKAFHELSAQPNELARTMAPHPLIHQELPYDPEYFVYNRRLAASSMTNYTADEVYWQVRRNVIMRHTAELPTEIKGPDAEKLLNKVFTRRIEKVKVKRCSYQFACYEDGGMITDGVLMRLEPDRFWYAQADGDLFSWLKAHSAGMDVEIIDPNVWVTQVQGPNALKVLEEAIDGDYPEAFNYFDVATVTIAGQPVVIARSGFTNELGWEYYLLPDTNIPAIGDRIMEAGKAFGMMPTSAEAFRARRIEAGMLNAGSDFDETTTPFVAGLGHMVDFSKADFIGKAALEEADKRNQTWGMRVLADGNRARNVDSNIDGTPVVPQIGQTLFSKGTSTLIGKVCSSAWSPFQQCGIALVRVDDATLQVGDNIEVECTDGVVRVAELCETPMYDKERLIPRGKLVDIPEILPR